MTVYGRLPMPAAEVERTHAGVLDWLLTSRARTIAFGFATAVIVLWIGIGVFQSRPPTINKEEKDYWQKQAVALARTGKGEELDQNSATLIAAARREGKKEEIERSGRRSQGRATDAAEPKPLLPTSGSLTLSRPEFSWSPVAGAEKIALDLKDASGSLLPQTQLKGNSVRWRPTASLVPGTVYFWQVTAFVSGFKHISQWQSFAVAPAKQEARIAVLQRQFRRNPLVLIAVYEQFGLYSDASRELNGLSDRTIGGDPDTVPRLRKGLADLEAAQAEGPGQ